MELFKLGAVNVIHCEKMWQLFGLPRCSTRTTFLCVVVFASSLLLYHGGLNRLGLLHNRPLVASAIPKEFLNPDRSRNTAERRYNIDGDLIGYIWPLPGSLRDRIVNQVNYMDDYASVRGDNRTKKKIILRVGDFNFLEMGWKDGQELLVQNKCPITDCWFSSDSSVSSLADALLISEFDSYRLRLYTPKPAHQIWITQHLESPEHNRIDPKSLG